MEGVGARLGRSSTRYGGPATVFTGPVRKWKKKWVHVQPANSSSNHAATNGIVSGGSNGASSHLLLYKWTPLAKDSTNNSGDDGSDKVSDNGNAETNKEDAVAGDEPPKKKFKYIPIILLEEQKNESPEQSDDEAKPIETDADTVEATFKSDVNDEKPDINDVPMEENQDPSNSPVERQDLNESTLDLSLGLNGHDGENESNPKPE